MKLKKYLFKKVISTNNTALRLVKNGKSSGAIISELQTKGRGQRGNKWISRKGNLFMTVFFEISKKLKIPSEEFIFLGDTGTDMKTAVAAGCFPVGALWGFRHEKELINNGARALVKKPIEILDLLDV